MKNNDIRTRKEILSRIDKLKGEQLKYRKKMMTSRITRLNFQIKELEWVLKKDLEYIINNDDVEKHYKKKYGMK